MKALRTAIAGILALFVASAAIAQTFPTVPSNTVIGRVGIGTGPSQAIPFATLAPRLNQALSQPGGYNAIAYGADPTGVNDSTPAVTAIQALMPNGCGAIYFPKGKYKFLSRITHTMSTDLCSFAVTGDGTDASILYWPNANGGLKVVYTASGNVSHVSSLTFTTGIISGGTGLELTQTDLLKAFPESTIKNVSFRGDAAHGDLSSQHWTDGVYIDSVSGVVMDTITVWGANNPATSGIRIHGPAGGALSHKISNSFFGEVGYGVKVDGFEQTLMINNTSFIQNDYGLYTQTGGDVYFSNNTLSTTVGGVYLADASLALGVFDCLFENFGGDAIYANDTRGVRIIGNVIGDPRGLSVGTRGIVLNGASSYGTITGNFIGSMSTAISFSAGSSHNNLKGNTYWTNTLDISDSGALNLLDSQFDKTITLKGANTVGLDFTQATGLVNAASFPNGSQLAWKDNAGTLRPVLGVSENIILGNSVWSIFTDTPNIIPLSDATANLGVAGGRWASVHTMLGKLYGSTSGVITIQGQAAAGTYNWNLPTGAGSAGQPLLSGGGGSSPMTFGTLGRAAGGTGQTTGAVVKVVVQKFTASGTYTPTTGLLSATIECLGGGAGGGGVAGAVGYSLGAGGGGAGSPSKKTVSAATVGASQTVTIGAGGTAAAAGNNSGGNGGDTSVGSLCIGKGGSGGGGNSSGGFGVPGAGGVAGTGDETGTGQPGGFGAYLFGAFGSATSGMGGSTYRGGGGAQTLTLNTTAGSNATGFGSGGSGGAVYNVATSVGGSTGTAGLVVVTEYVNQ